MNNVADTICAPATIAGSGAISVIRVSGPEALSVADRVVRFKRGTASEAPGYSLRYGSIDALDDVLVSIFKAPHSYTGEDGVEISCHASSYIVSGILERLCDAGCRLAGPGEFTRRAFVNGKMDLAQAEAVADVIASTSEAEHKVAMAQLRGGYSDELRQIRSKLVELSALLELELDFSEEEVEFADRAKLRALAVRAGEHCGRLADSFRSGNALKNGIPVAIAGAPNSGKSTLLNALLGEDRAIVSDIPGTTRDTVEEVFTLEGIKFRLIDTAGLRESGDIVEKMGIERSYAAVSKAFVVIGVIDGGVVCQQDGGAATFASLVGEGQKLILVRSKADIHSTPGEAMDEDANEVAGTCAGGYDRECGGDCDCGCAGAGMFADGRQKAIRISARTGYGMDRLRAAIAEAGRRFVGNGDHTLVTNARHAAALRAAAGSLTRVVEALDSSTPGDLIAEDLRAAINHLGSILGESITPDEVLGEIFGRFCIGK